MARVVFTIEDASDEDGNPIATVTTEGVVNNAEDSTLAERIGLEIGWLLCQLCGLSWDEIAREAPPLETN